MTKAELITAVRSLVNELSTDSGALLSDTGNLLEFIHDATEQVVLDLVPIMPTILLTSENITLVAGTQAYALTNSYLQIWKVEKTVTDESPSEIHIIDPLEQQFYTDVSETDDEPGYCYFMGNSIYFVPIPSAAATNYAKVWEIRSEPATMATAGPTYLPTYTHRLIVYKACTLVAAMVEADAGAFEKLYAHRFSQVERVYRGMFQQKARFVKDSVGDRITSDGRLSYNRDKDWPW